MEKNGDNIDVYFGCCIVFLPLKFKIDHHREELYLVDGPKDYVKILELE
jgi:hypothetical protein